ncbi:DUF4870 domain-containing protein [Haloarchaeobius sp. DFWS5]|uniref:DUF4870 domain-containing protein n=1 Tax=Haloarchaeobius sp. DFWS5 TaxID=3446114 RepID=UPI003EB70351
MAVDDVSTTVHEQGDQTTTHGQNSVHPPQSSLGVEENVGSALAYALGIISGLVVFFMESENQTVRWHGAQSIVVWGGIIGLSMVIGFVNLVLGIVVGGILGGLLSLLGTLVFFGLMFGSFVLWLYLMYSAYQGKQTRLPVAAGIADSLAN